MTGSVYQSTYPQEGWPQELRDVLRGPGDRQTEGAPIYRQADET